MALNVLLIDGNWNLKRNFLKRETMFANGEHCGGSFGFLDSLRAVVNKEMPDRVVVMWDGPMGGKMRHDIYPHYKENREGKSWDEESYYLTERELDYEAKKKYSKMLQKIKVKNYLEELHIRQTEVDYVEADDLIAQYVLTKKSDEKITIFSSDKDYYGLIQKDVCVLRPVDDLKINIDNFKTTFGYIPENALILRCFEGDDSDNIPGVDGIAYKSIIKYFPRFQDEVYDVDRFIKEAVELYQKKQNKTLEKIIGCRRVIERNLLLMNLHKPFLTEQAIQEVDEIHNLPIVEDNNFTQRSISTAMKMMIKDGYNRHVWNENLEFFFRPFYRLVAKEVEFSKKILNS
jgi:5'-3' exonuclease